MPPTTRTKFEIGEYFVCLYKLKEPFEAKVTAISIENDVRLYRIHYTGWKAKHDEKIQVGKEAGRMFKGTLDEYAKAHNVQISSYAVSSAKIRHRAPRRQPVEPVRRRIKLCAPRYRRKPYIEENVPLIADLSQVIDIPQDLKEIISRDHEMMGEEKLTDLSTIPSIDSILTRFIKWSGVKQEELSQIEEMPLEFDEAGTIPKKLLVTSGRALVDYFNAALEIDLLFPHEISQYVDLIHNEYLDNEPDTRFRASQHYGIIHLLRMFEKLPVLLQNASFSQTDVQRTIIGFNAFLVFLSRKHDLYYDRFSDYGLQKDASDESDADEETKDSTSREMDQPAEDQPGTSASSNN